MEITSTVAEVKARRTGGPAQSTVTLTLIAAGSGVGGAGAGGAGGPGSVGFRSTSLVKG